MRVEVVGFSGLGDFGASFVGGFVGISGFCAGSDIRGAEGESRFNADKISILVFCERLEGTEGVFKGFFGLGLCLCV